MKTRFRRTGHRSIVLAMFVALVASAFAMVGSTAQAAVTATSASATTATCPTRLWERDIAQSHEERKFKKKVTDSKTQHWAKYQKHVKGRIEKKYGGNWYDTGADFDWTKWEGDFWNTSGSFKIRDWSDTASPDVIEEGGHSSASDTYQQNGWTYRWVSESYSYRVIERLTRQVQTGSHYVYYLPGGGSSLTNTDANWTTETPPANDGWVQFDQRVVQDQPIHQGPVRSVDSPPLNYDGVNSNVPWTMIPGTEEPCPPPPPYNCPPGTTGGDEDGDGVIEPNECHKPKKVRGDVGKIDKCGRSGDYYYTDRVKGGHYVVKGKTVTEGLLLKAKTLVVKIKFVADSHKYKVVGKKKWALRFTNKACPPPPYNPPPTGTRA